MISASLMVSVWTNPYKKYDKNSQVGCNVQITIFSVNTEAPTTTLFLADSHALTLTHVFAHSLRPQLTCASMSILAVPGLRTRPSFFQTPTTFSLLTSHRKETDSVSRMVVSFAKGRDSVKGRSNTSIVHEVFDVSTGNVMEIINN